MHLALAPEAIIILMSLHMHRAVGFSAAHLAPRTAFVQGAGWHYRHAHGAVQVLRGPRRERGAGHIRLLLHKPCLETRRPLSMQALAGDAPEFGAGFLGRMAPQGAVRRPVQTVDFTTISAVSTELQARLPMRVGTVRQAGETDITIALFDPDVDLKARDTDPANDARQRLWLSLSWHRKFGRMSFSAREPLRSSDSGAYALRRDVERDGIRAASEHAKGGREFE
jgi:hypothetical protein